MTTILLFKATTAPLLIVALTLLIRQFGPTVGGLAMGVPLITGPISVFTLIEHGAGFAREAAVGNLVGQVSTCIFCLTYGRSAARSNPAVSTASGVLAFTTATLVWRQFDWTLAGATLLLGLCIALLLFALPGGERQAMPRTAPAWDLPIRMIVASGFVLVLTSLTGVLGPQLSGLVAPFPVFVLILAVFTHLQHGGRAVLSMMRGVIIGSLSFGSFFLVVALGLAQMKPLLVYGIAALASIGVSSLVYLRLQRQRPRAG